MPQEVLKKESWRVEREAERGEVGAGGGAMGTRDWLAKRDGCGEGVMGCSNMAGMGRRERKEDNFMVAQNKQTNGDK